jgi:hypothetical protein
LTYFVLNANVYIQIGTEVVMTDKPDKQAISVRLSPMRYKRFKAQAVVADCTVEEAFEQAMELWIKIQQKPKQEAA